ncbi:MAG: DUF2520 domain-containing protein [Bacteroidetes bacterium]|nr:DUF2520 domain-containing protein [Bacteroidota bacterium]
MKVVIIGSGNVATVLGRKIAASGHSFLQIVSNTEEHAAVLAKALDCGYTSQLEDIDQEADLYIIAISDSELFKIDKKLSLGDKMVVHTAGSVSKQVLSHISSRYGVLYPLQSLRKEISKIPEIPFLVDANSDENLKTLFDFATTISDKVVQMGDADRQKLHAGAIIVNNFTNHLFALTEAYCNKENLDFRLLVPLINETASRLNYFSPSLVQTGPAIRNDLATIQHHLNLLQANPALLKIYELMTASIRANNQHK